MNELTYEEFCDLHFEYRYGMADDWGAIRQYRNDECGIWKHLETKRKRKGDIYSGWHSGVVTYYLDNDQREFESFEDLYVAYMEKVCGIALMKRCLEALENSRPVGNDDDIQGLEIAHRAAIIELRWRLEGEA